MKKSMRKFYENDTLNKGYTHVDFKDGCSVESGDASSGEKLGCGDFNLPSLSMLKEYESVTPGITERMLAMAESEQKYRHGRDNAYAQMTRTTVRMTVIAIVLIVAIICFYAVELARSHVFYAIIFAVAGFIGLLCGVLALSKRFDICSLLPTCNTKRCSAGSFFTKNIWNKYMQKALFDLKKGNSSDAKSESPSYQDGGDDVDPTIRPYKKRRHKKKYRPRSDVDA